MKTTGKKIWAALGGFLLLMLLFTFISRGIYAAGLPQVTTERPRRGSLNHEVKAAGNVIQGRELAVSVNAGLRVREIFVQAGDRVEAGSPLFALDTEYLKQLIREKELEIQKLELQAATINYNQHLANEEKNREMNQANLDGLEAISDAQVRLARAEEDERLAHRKLELHSNDTDDCQSEADWEMWEEKRQALAELHEQAKRELEDAQDNLEDVLAEITRKQQEVTAPMHTDSSVGTSMMELEQKKMERSVLQGYMENQGMICADMQAVITDVFISPGNLTGNGAAMTYGDLSQPFLFEVLLDKEQKKYVELGMEAKLRLGSQLWLDVTVDYLTQSPNGDGSYFAGINLPEGTGTIGQSGEFSTSVQSEVYPLCVSMDAVQSDASGRKYIYIMEETDTVLGRELVARKISVELLDSNGKAAAVSSAALNDQTEIIIQATKAFEDGDVIRTKE